MNQFSMQNYLMHPLASLNSMANMSFMNPLASSMMAQDPMMFYGRSNPLNPFGSMGFGGYSYGMPDARTLMM